MSRQLVYLQFGNREVLLLEAALDLTRRELLPHLQDASDELTGRDRALATARHFANHRSFYRAMLTGSCAFALNEALNGLFYPLNRQFAKRLLGEGHELKAVDDLATFLTGGGAAIFNSWLIEGEDPLDPEHFADRLMRTLSVLSGAAREQTTTRGGPR